MSNLLNAISHAKSGMISEAQRLNAVASNIASANSESSNAEGAYRAKKVVFQRVLDRESGQFLLRPVGVVESQAQPIVRFAPGHPFADKEGYVYGSNVNVTEEMADMMSANHSYSNNALVAKTIKQIQSQTLQLGK